MCNTLELPRLFVCLGRQKKLLACVLLRVSTQADTMFPLCFFLDIRSYVSIKPSFINFQDRTKVLDEWVFLYVCE